jgi:hypothetical protein
MSLKAGGVGINLTAASNAFVMVCTMLNFLLSKLWQDFSLNLHFHMPMYNLRTENLTIMSWIRVKRSSILLH